MFIQLFLSVILLLVKDCFWFLYSQFNYLFFFLIVRLTGSFKSKMKAADNFWSTLPDNVCGDISVKQNSDCWNGVGKGR